MLTAAFLILNVGSATLKFSLFDAATLNLQYAGQIDSLFQNPHLSIYNPEKKLILESKLHAPGLAIALQTLFKWFQYTLPDMTIQAIGHRVVHGGEFFSHPIIIDAENFRQLQSLIPLAPLHQPFNLEGITLAQKHFPQLTQIACFDTAFHHTQSRLARSFALPQSLTEEGILRYGFHGLSYAYIASILPQYAQKNTYHRVIVAHLGNGASACALKDLKSTATSMGFSTLDGLMMGTRCGSLDPGVILYLGQTKKWSFEKISTLLYKESGLLGVSGESADMRVLLASSYPQAQFAIALFCYRAAEHISALGNSLQGCDALVFTGGIGENADQVREKICQHLAWWGVKINSTANRQHATLISEQESTISVYVIPTNEDKIIVNAVQKIIAEQSE